MPPNIPLTAMEAPARIFNRHLVLSKSTPTTMIYQKPSLCHRSLHNSQQLCQSHLIAPIHLSVPRTHSSFSPISCSSTTPNRSPNNFLLSFSSPNLSNSSNPISNVNFCFKSNSKEGFFAWNHVPEGVIDGKVGAFGAKDPAVTVVLLGWLGAKPKHLKKYVELYNSKGIHAITFIVEVRELFRFDLGQKVEKRMTALANELISWVSAREDDGRERCLLFHSFSNTGWLVFGYIIDIMQGREGVVEKIKGCVADSGGAELLTPKVWAAGFSAALLQKHSSATRPAFEAKEINGSESQIVESKAQEEEPLVIEGMVLSILEKLFSVILKMSEVDEKLKKIVSTLANKQPHCPHLYLYSTADKVIPFQLIEFEIENQKKMGKNVLSYNFKSSPHVDHYRTFPDIYLSMLDKFLKECFATMKQT